MEVDALSAFDDDDNIPIEEVDPSFSDVIEKTDNDENTILLPEVTSSSASNGIQNAADEQAIVFADSDLLQCDTPISDPMEEVNALDEDDVPLVVRRRGGRKPKKIPTEVTVVVSLEEPEIPAVKKTPTQVPKKRRDAALLAAVTVDAEPVDEEEEEEEEEEVLVYAAVEEEEEPEEVKPAPKRRGRKPGFRPSLVKKKESDIKTEIINIKQEPTTSKSVNKKDDAVLEEQCRVCMTTNDLVSLFKKVELQKTAADLLMSVCTTVSIAENDFMPQYICKPCLEHVNIACQLRQQCETTEKELRSRLSRSKNKIRRPTAGYVVIDAPDSDVPSDVIDAPDDNDFKISEDSPSPDDDSEDFDFGRSKPKRRMTRGRRGRRKSSMASLGSPAANRVKSESPIKIKKRMGRPPKAATLAKIAKIEQDPIEKDAIDINNLTSESEDNSLPAKKKRSSSGRPSSSAKEYPCLECTEVFNRKSLLVQHRKLHLKSQNLNCEVCGKQFKQQGSYKSHLARHQEEAQLKCPQCDKTFTNKTERRRHMVDVHNEPAATHVCEKCKRAFTTEQRLAKHKDSRCPGFEMRQYTKKVEVESMSLGRDLFKSVAPLTTTYWSDSFSD